MKFIYLISSLLFLLIQMNCSSHKLIIEPLISKYARKDTSIINNVTQKKIIENILTFTITNNHFSNENKQIAQIDDFVCAKKDSLKKN
jgi:hypothetical protein